MRREIKRKYAYGLLLCLSVNLLAGCKEKTVDYSMEGATESTQKENSVSNTVSRGKKELKQFADAPVWSSWKEEYDWSAENAKGEKVNITLRDVEVTVPDAEEMSVVEVKEPEFDAAYKKQISERIFGDTEIYYNDFAHLPRKDIVEQRESCQTLYQLAKDTEEVSYANVKYLTRQYQFDPENAEEWKDILEQELLRYDNALEAAGDVYTPVSKYDADEYLGTYGGMDYELSFSESDRVRKTDDGPYLNGKSEDGFFMNCRGKEISFRVKDIYQVCPEEVKEVEGLYYGYMASASQTNQSSLSKEDAKELAQDVVDELNLDYSVYNKCEPLSWWKGVRSGVSEAYYLSDGYIFYFDVGVDSVSFPQFGTQQTDWNFRKLKKETEEPQYFMKSQIEVYVNDKGVIGMRAYNPIETVSVSEGVDLLQLDVVKRIIREQLTEHFKDFRFKVGSFDGEKFIQFERLELIYFRVRDKENVGYYSYIPVWRLSGLTDISSLKYFANPVLINAIDGSVIDFYEEA